MSVTEFVQSLEAGAGGLATESLQMLPRIALALAIGALVAKRPWRRFMKLPPVKAKVWQAEALLCVAGALVAVVVGQSVARAFGLVGLGGLVRFRTAIKDPREGAVFFLLIALGMAIGLGEYAVGLAAGAFLAALLAYFDRRAQLSPERPRMRLKLQVDDPVRVESALRPAFELAQVAVRSSASDANKRTLELVVDEPRAGAVARVLAAATLPAATVRCEAVDAE